MRIEHLAIYCENLDLLRDFYTGYFGLECGSRYENRAKDFSSYFLRSKEGGARLELMNLPNLPVGGTPNKCRGLAHIAISVGSKEQVDLLTEKLRSDGFKILSEPRTTGDGYYESAVEDPEGNYVEITV
ncbi:MAG: VOC family protein [Bacteroidales bacterium]|nr:VOC family protein [Bacteroidales bacterium]